MSSERLIPREMEQEIFNYFSAADLWLVSQVSHVGYDLARYIHRQKCLAFYKRTLADSTLWKHLPQIVNNGSLVEYFQLFLTPEQFKLLPLDYLESTSSLIEALNIVSNFNLNCLQNDFGYKGTLLEKGKFIIEQFQTVSVESIQDFLTSSSCHKLLVLRTYHYIEALFTLFALFMVMRRLFNDERLLILIDKRWSQWLTGFGLLRLLTYSSDNFFHVLVKYVIEKNALSVPCCIEKMLLQLTDDDLWDYSSIYLERQEVLLYAVEKRYSLLTDKIGIRTLTCLIKNAPKEVLLALLFGLSSARLSLAITKLEFMSFKRVIEEYEIFMSLLLSGLALEELSAMFKGFISEKFSCMLNSSAFLAFLDNREISFKDNMETCSSLNNGKLISKEHTLTTQSPVKITLSASALLIHLGQLKCYFPPYLINSKAAAQYLTARDVLLMMDLIQSSEKDIPLELKNHIHKFTDLNDFLGLAHRTLYKKNNRNLICPLIEAELRKRFEALKGTLEIGKFLLYEEVAYWIIKNNPDFLNNEELTSLRNCFGFTSRFSQLAQEIFLKRYAALRTSSEEDSLSSSPSNHEKDEEGFINFPSPNNHEAIDINTINDEENEERFLEIKLENNDGITLLRNAEQPITQESTDEDVENLIVQEPFSAFKKGYSVAQIGEFFLNVIFIALGLFLTFTGIGCSAEWSFAKNIASALLGSEMHCSILIVIGMVVCVSSYFVSYAITHGLSALSGSCSSAINKKEDHERGYDSKIIDLDPLDNDAFSSTSVFNETSSEENTCTSWINNKSVGHWFS